MNTDVMFTILLLMSFCISVPIAHGISDLDMKRHLESRQPTYIRNRTIVSVVCGILVWFGILLMLIEVIKI